MREGISQLKDFVQAVLPQAGSEPKRTDILFAPRYSSPINTLQTMSTSPNRRQASGSTDHSDLVTSQQAYNDALKLFLDRFTTAKLKTGDQITGFQIRLYTPIGSATDGNGISVEEMDLMFMGSLMPKAYVLHRRAEREARRRYQVATQRRSDSGGRVRGGVPPGCQYLHARRDGATCGH